MNKSKIMIIFGTRPEAIKMAPVVKELRENHRYFKTIVCITAQHRHMLDQVMSLFNIKADLDLDLMRKNQSLESLASRALVTLSKEIREISPDLVIVQGDTTTAMVAALAAFYQKIPVAHVEAGLRTHDIYNPFPEEANRCIISSVATFNFAPTKRAFETLIGQGIKRKRVFLTGNTVIDALKMLPNRLVRSDRMLALKKGQKLILMTAHRRENFGRPLENICDALQLIVKRNPDVVVVYPVHLNPNVKTVVYGKLSGQERIFLIPPLEYRELVAFMRKSSIILTDSGGIQEEAPAFGKPVLVMRKETERPEGIEAGVAKLVGTDTRRIVKEIESLLRNKALYERMSKAVSPYGDGRAAKRIARILKKEIG